MTRNNLRDQLSWLLRNVSISLPAGPSLPTPPDSSDSQTTTGLGPPLSRQPQLPSTGPPGPAFPPRSTQQPPPSFAIPPADAARFARPQHPILAAPETTEDCGGMARLTSSTKSKKPSLLVRQQHAPPTPASTTSIPPLQRAFSQLVDSTNAASKKKNTPPTPHSGRRPRSPAFSSDIFDNIDNLETLDLTSDDNAVKSSPQQALRIWKPGHSSRTETLPKKSGKKRKSAEMLNLCTPTAKKSARQDDDDEFPDAHTLAELGSNPRKRGRVANAAPASSQQTPVKAPVGAYAKSVVEERTITETISRTETRVRRADATLGLTQHPFVAVMASPRRKPASSSAAQLPSRAFQGLERVSRQGPRPPGCVSEPQSSSDRNPDRQSRKNLVIEDSEDESLASPTDELSFFTCVSGSGPARGGDSGMKFPLVSKPSPDADEDGDAEIETPSRQRSRAGPRAPEGYQPPTDRIMRLTDAVPSPRATVQQDPAEEGTQSLKPAAYSSDSEGTTLIMDLFLRNPTVIEKRRLVIEQQLTKNTAEYRRALDEGWPRERKEHVKEDRKPLKQQQTVLDSLESEYEAYKSLADRKSGLVAKLLEAFENDQDTTADEAVTEQLSEEIQAKEHQLRRLLAAAGIDSVEIFDEAVEDAPPGNRHSHIVLATQAPSPHPVARLSRQSTVVPDQNSQVIFQTQVQQRPPPPRFPNISGRDEYGDEVLAPQPPPFPRGPNGFGRERSRPAPQPASSFHQDPNFGFGGLLSDDDNDDDVMQLFESTVSKHRETNTRSIPAAPLRGPGKPSFHHPDTRGTSEFDYLDDAEDDESMMQFAESLEREPAAKPAATQKSRSPLAEASGNSSIVPRSKKTPSERTGKMVHKASIPSELMRHPWSNDVRKALKDHFRMSGFRQNQLETINATLAGRDAFVLMPTGGGKSLCYQLPAVIDSGATRGITVVVSPLLSLMQDQIDHLHALRIVARPFSGDMKPEVRRMILDALADKNPENSFRLLYVTPEMIGKSVAFLRGLDAVFRNNRLARIVIDEAHCVSQWGHDFRPDYKALGQLRRRFPRVPLIALTATATPNVIEDVKLNLDLNNCQQFSQSFNRPNLRYYVLEKTTKKADLPEMVELIRGKHAGQTGIIYTLSRNTAEQVADKLREQHGILAAHYHAHLESHQKVQVQRDWQSGKIKVVVATIAFGMGIDKPDVRFVIHHSVPKSIEGYYQETGRAGRDGEVSHCYLFFSYGDVVTLRKMIDDTRKDRDKDGNLTRSPEQRERQKAMLHRVVNFCEDRRDCRRLHILRYFAERFDPNDCNKTCDNCSDNSRYELTDHSATAVKVLEAVREHGRLTLVQATDAVKGKGEAKGMKISQIHSIIFRLNAEDALAEENRPGPNRTGMVIQYFIIGPMAHEFLRGSRKLEVVTRQEKETQPKPRKKRGKAGTDAEAGAPSAKQPPSTNVSSPVRSSGKRKRSARAALILDQEDAEADDDDGGDGLGLLRHANGYAKDNFVVSDLEEDDDDFEPVRQPLAKARAKGRQRTLEELGGPIRPSDGGSIQEAGEDADADTQLSETHRMIVDNFVQQAKELEEHVRNGKNLRRVLFTEQQFRAMATRWTTSLPEMARIEGVSRDNVHQYGDEFLALLQRMHRFYVNAMHEGPGDGGNDVVDLVSSDDDRRGPLRKNQPVAAAAAAMTEQRRRRAPKAPFVSSDDDEDEQEEEEHDEEGEQESSRYFAFPAGGSKPTTAAERKRAELDKAMQDPFVSRSSGGSGRFGSGSGARGGAASYTKWSSRAGGGGGRKKSYTRRPSGGGVTKRRTASRKSESSGLAAGGGASSSSAAAFGSGAAKGKGGKSRGRAGSGIGMMPL